MASLPGLARAFEEITGWSLTYHRGTKPTHPTEFAWSAPADPGVGNTPGHARFDLVRSASTASGSRVSAQSARRLASAIEGLVKELVQTRQALGQREAELAAAPPPNARADDQRRLAVRLHSVLRGGAEAVGCHAAALYLLDEATTSLKLRASWGLPAQRLADPPRPLRGALADLEAMLGHAVVLEDTGLLEQWNPPEDFPAAVCLPVATPTTILGTLWVFSNAQRDFNARETNILEVVAGRLAADLERETLHEAGTARTALQRQLEAAQRVQQNQLPTIAPMIGGWDLAGWTSTPPTLGGDFHDWFCLPHACVAFAVGSASAKGIEAALIAVTVKAALRAHGQYHRTADALLRQVNLTLWTGSAGDQSASLLGGFVEATSDRVRYCLAGNLEVLLLRPDGWQPLPPTCDPVGQSPESPYRQAQCHLQPGHSLLVYTPGLRPVRASEPAAKRQALLAKALLKHLSLPAKELVARTRTALGRTADIQTDAEGSILVLKRKGS